MYLQELIQPILQDPAGTALIVSNLIIIEGLLSVDNAAVLATMVMDLPKHQRHKALRYGIVGAYVFRGLCLLFASFLVQIWWLKPIGGLYLLYLVVDWWRGKRTRQKKEKVVDKQNHWLYKITIGTLGNFWATVVLVELMDMAFSIDNVFAAVAFSDNILIISLGVFIGILAMRFVAKAFIRLMEKYAFLETCAFAVIALLGVKLTLSLYEHVYPKAAFSKLLASQEADWITSAITIMIFFIPVLTSALFNVPAKKAAAP